MKGRRFLSLALAFALGLALAQGEALYGQYCAACHGAQGQGIPGAIPGLLDHPSLADEARFLRAVRQGIGAMPPLPHVAEAQAREILAYLRGLSGAPAEAPAPPPPALAAEGDAELGRALFLGQRRFQNGGAPCQACHTVAGLGFLGGGSLGQDLTRVAERLGGEAGLRAVLQNPTAWPVMREAYRDKPLTEAEAAALAAFFVQAAQETPRPPSLYLGRYLVAGLLFVGLLLLYQAVLWQLRPKSLAERIREQLRRRA
ncbi:c-type cytochrome [Thermus thermamylovorans]|uniref:Cytochrome c n=1 Tax=Thermus thermamylovorans TaxID=2509362 RepID=A0A4Q9B439_9DEIN|nr:cytochrome c [Thermus thermamylovorans]TBH20069.1 cytochrome c [Thermus thermamylovorans]